MTGFHMFMFMLGGFILMIGLHNSMQLFHYPASSKLKGHRLYQEVYAASGMMVVLGLTLLCSALRAMSPF